MATRIFARRLVTIGLSVSALGVILYSQLDWVASLRLGLGALNTAATLSIAMTLFGLLATLTGSVFWAWRASKIIWVFASGLSIGIVTLLVAEFANINIHGPLGIIIVVVLAGVTSAALLLLIAVIRLIQSWRA